MAADCDSDLCAGNCDDSYSDSDSDSDSESRVGGDDNFSKSA
jgi:hypothetical protein